MSALTAAYFLTDPSLGGRYQVSVYTMGWRLGGKGASGRNAALHNRIEEHGLHIWFGTYHNAIALMRRCYAELGRPPGDPLATFDEAFKGQRRVVLTETVNGAERDWPIDFLDFPVLGHDQTVLTLLRRLVGWILERARAVRDRLRRLGRPVVARHALERDHGRGDGGSRVGRVSSDALPPAAVVVQPFFATGAMSAAPGRQSVLPPSA